MTSINLRLTKRKFPDLCIPRGFKCYKRCIEFTISLISQSDEQIFARFQTKELLTDMKINFYPSTSVDSKLVRTMSNETYTFVEYFQCTKEEKY